MAESARNSAVLTGADLQRMLLGACTHFEHHYDAINALNVFPVPDGDTGTNMLLTLTAVRDALTGIDPAKIGTVAKVAADSALMGARGNSGVILSQLLRGIARGLNNKVTATSAEVSKAFQYGIIYAYKAVAKPVEGTILTVAKGIAKGAYRAVREQRDFPALLEAAVAGGQSALAQTPEMLVQLKQAGVVDAGGKGLVVFLEGCLHALGKSAAGAVAETHGLISQGGQVVLPAGDKSFGYCTEFILRGEGIPFAELREGLAALGDSLIAAEGDGLVKVHIHTAHPGQVLEHALTWGTLHGIKIENMTDQHLPHKHTAIIAVSPGEGISALFRQLGVDVVIPGGQTMNPPVREFVAAMGQIAAENYLILPNNKNIHLAAEQVKRVTEKNVVILPTVSVPEGLAALLAYTPGAALADNCAVMEERMRQVKSGAVTRAVRDTVHNGMSIAMGNYIGLFGGNIVVNGVDMDTTVMSLVEQMRGATDEIVALYYGSDVESVTAEKIKADLAAAYPDITVELHAGGQPHYHFLVGIE